MSIYSGSNTGLFTNSHPLQPAETRVRPVEQIATGRLTINDTGKRIWIQEPATSPSSPSVATSLREITVASSRAAVSVSEWARSWSNARNRGSGNCSSSYHAGVDVVGAGAIHRDLGYIAMIGALAMKTSVLRIIVRNRLAFWKPYPQCRPIGIGSGLFDEAHIMILRIDKITHNSVRRQ